MAKRSAKEKKEVAIYLFLVHLLPFLILLAIPFVCEPMDFSVDMFTRDTNAVAGTHPFVGLVSNIGIIIWTITAAICLFSGIILYFCSNRKKFGGFLIFSGIITMLLMLDDFFQLHEVIYKSYFGVDEVVIFSIYFILLFGDLIIFRQIIHETEYPIMLVAGGFFILSLLVDHFQSEFTEVVGSDLRILLEDGFKLFGIAGWFAYFAYSSYQELRRLIKRA